MKRNGYRPSHRNRFLLLEIISLQAFILLEYYLDQMDFDPRHKMYGTFEVCFSDLCEVFHCGSETTIRNWHKLLIKQGLIICTERKNVFAISRPERYICATRLGSGKADQYAEQEKDQSIEVILQSLGQALQHTGHLHQSIGENHSISQINTPSKALSSFKVDSSVPQSFPPSPSHSSEEIKGKEVGISNEDAFYLNSTEYMSSFTPVRTNKTVEHLTDAEVLGALR